MHLILLKNTAQRNSLSRFFHYKTKWTQKGQTPKRPKNGRKRDRPRCVHCDFTFDYELYCRIRLLPLEVLRKENIYVFSKMQDGIRPSEEERSDSLIKGGPSQMVDEV